MQKEESIRINGNKNMILKFRDETALNDRFLVGSVWCLGTLHVFRFKEQPQTGQREYHLTIVIVILQFGRCSRSSGLRT